MESKKDILLESNLLNFNILAAVIVIPALLTPAPMIILEVNQ